MNNNNLIRVSSTRLAEDYTVEFEEMFSDDLFGPDVRADTPYPSVKVGDVLVEVYFSPDDGIASHLTELIQSAKESIFFLAYSFTSDELATAMLERAGNGVTVSGVFEEGQYESNVGSEYDRFKAEGVEVRLDGNPRNMHHKVIIIDGNIVVVGSYNLSGSAEKRNDENVLIIHDAHIAAQYLEEFERVFNDGHQ